MTDTHTSGLRLAQLAGITSSSFLSGAIFFISYGVIPPLRRAPPAVAVKQWRDLYANGASMAPPIAVVSMASWAYCAYCESTSIYASYVDRSFPNTTHLYTLAALLVVSIVPFTVLLMEPDVNKALMEKAVRFDAKGDDQGQGQRGEVERLLRNWGMWNLGRAGLVGLGALVGGWTVLGGLYGEGLRWGVGKL